MAKSVAIHAMPPPALKPFELAVWRIALYVVPDCEFHSFTKCPWPPKSIAASHASMPIHTITNVAAM
jgi:hypothetical protein